METNKLIHFHSVARHLNFTKAAEECHIAQTAISRSIASLEEELGFKLFERNNHNVSLTPAGNVFLNDTISITNDLYTSIFRAKSVSETYTEYLSIGYGAYEIPIMEKHIEAYLKENPKTEIELYQYSSIELPAQLLDKSCDITYGPYNRFYDLQRADIIEIGKSQTSLACSKDSQFAGLDYVVPSMLSGIPFVIPAERNSILLTDFSRRCERVGFTPSKIITTNTPEAMLTYVAMHLGFSLVPTMFAPYARRDITLVPVKSKQGYYKRHLCACLKNTTNDAALKFFNFVKDATINEKIKFEGLNRES